ncbi:MAG: SDR family oxidoreductase [Myxococcota bacterium]
MPLRTFDEAVCLITGGASGIGRALGAELVARGARVVLADRDVEGAQATAQQLGERATAMPCDVTDPEQVHHVVTTTFDDHGRLDFLFNNAGISIAGPVRLNETSHWNKVLDVNVRGVVHGVQAAYPKMIEQGFGHIINTASVAGFLPTPGFVSYGVSKHAVVGLSAGLRIEAARHGIRVTALCPGFVQTPILSGGKYGGRVDNRVDLEEVGRTARMMNPMDPTRFARKVVPRIARNQAVIVVPGYWRLLRALYRLAPGLLTVIARQVLDPERLDPTQSG